MKRNLLVRAGAITMALSVAFFSIVPDLVNAGGESGEAAAEIEAVAEAPGEEAAAEAPETAPKEDTSAADAPELSGGDEADTTDTSVPDTADTTIPDTSEVVVPDGPEVTEPDADTDVSDKDTEEVETKTPTENEPVAAEPEQPAAQDPASGETTDVQPEAPVASEPEGNPTDDESSEMDSIEDYLKILAESREEFKEYFEDGSADEIVAEDDEEDLEDFEIDGTTLVKYNGAGGDVVIPEGITAIGANAFLGNTSVTSVAFPSSLQSIGSSAFYGCSSLISIAVPEGVSSIGFAAFGNCSNLSSASLPSTLTSLDMAAFTGDVNLASISVADGGYSSYDGCVYSAGGSQLLLCPQGKTGISFASGMQSVGSGAFSGCNYLLSAAIPNAASVIEENAFSGSAIKSVTIPASVTSIGSQANWSPSVIYGYTGSAAESWADANGYVFESLNGSQGGEEEENPGHIEDPDPTNPNPNPGGTKTGGSTPAVRAASPAAAASVSKNVSSHVKDATPKTGVNDHRIFFLFGAFFLMGIACLTFSRKLSLDGKKNM